MYRRHERRPAVQSQLISNRKRPPAGHWGRDGCLWERGEAGSVADKQCVLSAFRRLWAVVSGLAPHGERDGGMERLPPTRECGILQRSTSPFGPQIHNFTSGASQFPTGCAGKPVFTRALYPRFGGRYSIRLERGTEKCSAGACQSAALGRTASQTIRALPRKRARRTTSKGHPKVQHGGLIHLTPQGFPPPS